MVKAKYLCLNGEFRPAADPVLLSGNRAFRFGDALFENIHAWSTEAQLLEKHYNRLITSMDITGNGYSGTSYPAVAFTAHYPIA